MANSFENSIPWDLISSSLQGELTAEEAAQLDQWVSANEEHKELFAWLNHTWRESFNDYKIYLEADESAALDALRLKMQSLPPAVTGTNIINGNFGQKRFSLMRWASVAAFLIVAAVSFIWYLNSKAPTTYETGVGEQKTISLSDGSSIKLLPGTRIEISRDYSRSSREVELKTGEAFFEIKHDEKIPFIVNLGSASVIDIGTSFSVKKQEDSIKLTVTSGKVAFINKPDNTTRELAAGMSLQLKTGQKIFDPVISIDSVTAKHTLLRFENTPLPDVILNMEKAYNKKIFLSDSALKQKRFTADLAGQSFERAIDILSRSLNIKYSFANGVYYLKNE